MTRAVLSIGSNVGNRLGHLRGVVERLGERAVAVSAVYETEPWGPVPQGPFLNAVVVADDPAYEAHDWLTFGRACETAAGRERTVPWGPRTLDVDVVAVNAGGVPVVSADPDLTLPHPRARDRAFVVVPWAEVDPTATLAGARVTELRDALPPEEARGVRRTDLTLPAVQR